MTQDQIAQEIQQSYETMQAHKDDTLRALLEETKRTLRQVEEMNKELQEKENQS